MRKNLNLIVAFITILIMPIGHARYTFGMLAGANWSTFSTGVERSGTINSATYSGTLGPSGLFGYAGGGAFRMEQSDWAIEVDMLYTQHSMKWHGQLNEEGGTGEVRNAMRITLNQIEVPVIGYYRMPVSKSVFKFGLGLYGSYGFGKIRVKDDLSNVPGSVVSTQTKYSWEDSGFNKFNIGGIVATGTDFKMGETSVLGFELRGQASFGNYTDKINPNFGIGGEKVGILCVSLMANYMF